MSWVNSSNWPSRAAGSVSATSSGTATGAAACRERIELLVDPDSPFLELSALAAWGTGFTVGATAAAPAASG